MNKFTYLMAVCCLALTVSCTVEDNTVLETLESEELSVTRSATHTTNSFIIECFSVALIAGQNMDAGTVSVTRDEDNLYITYNASGDWQIDATHLSVGDCDSKEISTTGSGNPKVGQFDLAADHPDGTVEVTYTISLDEVPIDYCFAAHADVSGPSGETAWAEGTPFDGNNWAMYVGADLSECIGGDM